MGTNRQSGHWPNSCSAVPMWFRALLPLTDAHSETAPRGVGAGKLGCCIWVDAGRTRWDSGSWNTCWPDSQISMNRWIGSSFPSLIVMAKHTPERSTELYRSVGKNQKPVLITAGHLSPKRVNFRMKLDNHWQSLDCSITLLPHLLPCLCWGKGLLVFWPCSTQRFLRFS